MVKFLTVSVKKRYEFSSHRGEVQLDFSDNILFENLRAEKNNDENGLDGNLNESLSDKSSAEEGPKRNEEVTAGNAGKVEEGIRDLCVKGMNVECKRGDEEEEAMKNGMGDKDKKKRTHNTPHVPKRKRQWQ